MYRRNLLLTTLILLLPIWGCSGGDDAPPAPAETPDSPAAAESPDPVPAPSSETAPASSPEDRAAATIRDAVETCRSEDWAGATAHFAYRGDDESRKWKDTWDPADEKERLRAKAGCDELLYGAFPETDSRYELGELSVEEESEGTWYVQEVSFPEDSDTAPIVVALLEVDGKMVIGDVD